MSRPLDSMDLEEYIEGKKSNEGNEKNSNKITEDDCGEHTIEKEPPYPIKGGPGMFFKCRYGQYCV